MRDFAGKRVAIKVLARRFSVDPEMLERFVAEAKAVLAGEKAAKEAVPGTAVVNARAAAPGGDMDRMLDPVVHASFLSSLHQATIVSEETGRLLQKVVGEEVEPSLLLDRHELGEIALDLLGDRLGCRATAVEIAPSLVPVTATGRPWNEFAPSGRDSQSTAFLRTPGIERLYSGVTISSPSAGSTCRLSSRPTSG